MCGIAGIIGEHKRVDDCINDMVSAQNHRGPDYSGIWQDSFISLGHNRLSIIDLSNQSNQPFEDVSERYTIVFNGEIYNYLEIKKQLSYKFKTQSDTEVLLAAYIEWGKKCLLKLNGMFSFAIWDKIEKKLFAARDRFGVKPFYYAHDRDKLIFASEIKAIHAAGIVKKKHRKVWANYLAHGSYGMPNDTFWENIHQLPGGHYLEYSLQELSVQKWYVFEEEIKNQPKNLTFEEVKRRYASLLKDSICLRFRADVPIGFNVSGGLDSSVLLNYVNKQNNGGNINAFTFYTGDKLYDELPWVKEMISITNNPLTTVKLSTKQIESKIMEVAKIQDEPYGGIPTVAYANIFHKAREKGVIVLLDGQGMDEQWAGYDYYNQHSENTIQGVNKSPFRKNVLSNDILQYSEKPVYPKPFDDELLNKQYRDLFYTKIPRALRFNDRVSMAASTELREPFLDYRLVEFAFSQPLAYKIMDGIQKYLLRELISEDLSDSITYAPKRALQTPQREWLSNELKYFVEERISVLETSKTAAWFDIPKLKNEWGKYLSGNNESSFHIWQWINVSLYADE